MDWSTAIIHLIFVVAYYVYVPSLGHSLYIIVCEPNATDLIEFVPHLLIEHCHNVNSMH